ncbi:MAG: co-chaperone GroES [Patescibacteria group bacterium]
MQIQPLSDRVILKGVEPENVTKGGILLPQSANRERPNVYEVVAVGPGGVVDGKEVTMYVEVGDKVVISKYGGTEVKLDGEDFLIMREDDILGVIQA